MSNRRTDNHGSLGKNKRQTTEKHPPYKGSATVGGVAYWLSAFLNEDRETGEKYFRLYFDPKKQTEMSVDSAPLPASLSGQPDIPF